MVLLTPPTPSSSRKRSELCISPAFGDVVAGASAPLVRPSKRPALQAPPRPRLLIPARPRLLIPAQPRRDEDEGYREINRLALPALSPQGVRPSPSPRPVSNAVVYFDIEEQAYRWHYGSTPELGGSRAAPIPRVIGYSYGGGGGGGGGSEDGSDCGDDETLLLTDEDLRTAAAVTRQQTRAATMKSAGRVAVRREELLPANDEAFI